MSKFVDLFNENLEENHISLSKEEEKIIEKQYEDYYAEEEDPNPAHVGNCCRCGLPISEFEPLWQITKVSGYGHIKDDSLVFCEECLIEFVDFIKK